MESKDLGGGLRSCKITDEYDVPQGVRRPCYVYILASRSRVLYIGVTSNLAGRLGQHADAVPGSFTARYRVNRLVYTEEYDDIEDAIARERQLKGWRREKKIRLITSKNPEWVDWSDGLF